LGYIFGAVSGFGFGVSALRLGGNASWKALIAGMLAVRLATTITVGSLLFLIFYSLSPGEWATFAAASTFIVVELVSELIQASYSGQGRQNLASLLLVLVRLPLLVGVLVAIWSAVDIWICLLSAGVFAFGILVASAIPLIERPHSPQTVIRHSAGYWASTLASSVGQLDVTFARFSAGVPAAGLLAAGSRIGTPLNLVTNAMLNVFVPSMTAETNREARYVLFRRIRRMSLGYAALLVLASPAIVWGLILILGDEYASGWAIYLALVVGSALSGISQTYQSLVYAEGRPLNAALCVGVGTLIGLGGLTIGGLTLGVLGLAIGPLVGQLSILLLFLRDRAVVNRQPPPIS
jgi:O-antigen/teichoic acid export membrane protein